MSKANETQIGGDHYKGAQCPHCGGSLEHWDLAWLFRWDNFQYAITKYVMRWREKAGLQDLEKAAHCLTKYIEVVAAEDPNKFTHHPERQRVEVAKPGDITSAGLHREDQPEWPIPPGNRWRCNEDLCPGHHLAQQQTCLDDPPGPASSVRPGK